MAAEARRAGSARRRRAVITAALLIALAGGLLAYGLVCTASCPKSPRSAHLPFPPGGGRGSAGGDWLGMNYNSSSNSGSLRDFASRGIVYDRGGALEVRAGHTIWRRGLQTSLAAGMIPDVYVNPARGRVGCVGDPNGRSRLCLPMTPQDVTAYVESSLQR